jgi:S-adenosylmethionine synthetase
VLLTAQASEIAHGVLNAAKTSTEQGAGDQGIMFGYATDETAELMPLPILLAHRLARALARDRKSAAVEWLRPDAKTQVSVEYGPDGRPQRVTDVLVSTHHAADVSQATIRAYVRDRLAPEVLGSWFSNDLRFAVNPCGSFAEGGPSVDCGVTGRKIIVDTYGGFGRHGGGAFSGKDPSKVDRSGAYFCRYVARQVVNQGVARRAEIQVAYAIGVAQPVSVRVDTFGTGDPRAAADFVRTFDFRPAAIIEQLNLLRPIYRGTTNYGHFGKAELPWES